VAAPHVSALEFLLPEKRPVILNGLMERMQKTMRQFASLTLATLLALAAGACAPESATNGTGGDTGEIPIGMYGALTGPTATFGQATREGVAFAIEEINASGGLLGRKLRLVAEDDQGKPEEAASVVSKLITRDGVIAIIGENSSSNTLAAAPIAQANRVPMVSPSSTNPEVTKKGDYIFRVCFTDPFQGKALAQFVRQNLKLEKAAILEDVKSDYSRGLADVFAQELEKSGGAIVARQSYAAGDSDFRAQLTAIRQAAPQVLFVPGYYTDAGQIALQARDLGLMVPLVGGDGWESAKLLEIGGEALNGSYFAATVSLASPDAATQKFVAAWQQKRGRAPEGLNALGYDAMMVVADAIRRAGSLDKTAIRDQIAATKGFGGASGEITFGPDRDPLKPVPIVGIREGKVEFLQSVRPQ
jgi:branched-chain amino acid transport system substrate-binding protein